VVVHGQADPLSTGVHFPLSPSERAGVGGLVPQERREYSAPSQGIWHSDSLMLYWNDGGCSTRGGLFDPFCSLPAALTVHKFTAAHHRPPQTAPCSEAVRCASLVSAPLRGIWPDAVQDAKPA
jgi:hypothetical protein